MEVHVHQHSATMAQAMAHNTRTILGDIEMFERVLNSRAPHEVPACRQAYDALTEAYNAFMDQFERFVEAEGLVPSTPEFEAEQARDTRAAERFETR
jgi:molecular chaperone GrpE (heat shock protein)